jgi:hypothetical protein
MAEAVIFCLASYFFSRLAGKAGPATLESTTSSGPSHDRGLGFCRRTHQGCKKSAGNKIIGE